MAVETVRPRKMKNRAGVNCVPKTWHAYEMVEKRYAMRVGDDNIRVSLVKVDDRAECTGKDVESECLDDGC